MQIEKVDHWRGQPTEADFRKGSTPGLSEPGQGSRSLKCDNEGVENNQYSINYNSKKCSVKLGLIE